MLKEKKEDNNNCIQHPTATAIEALRLSGLWHHKPAVVHLSFLYLASSHTRIWFIREKMLKFRADRRVRYVRCVRCDDGREGRRKFTASARERSCSEKKSGAGGQAGLQCSAAITDQFYERMTLLGAVRVSGCLCVRRRLCCALNVIPDVSGGEI